MPLLNTLCCFRWLQEPWFGLISLSCYSPRHPSPGAGDELGDPEDLGAFTPSFLWLLRDFYFDMTDEGRKVWGRSGI